MEYGVQPTIEDQQVLVVAIPNDPQALGLAEALSALELNVIIAETAEMASLADEAAVCIIVLHPETWRSSPSIRTAMRCKPPYMLPVLAEPMPLPSASWITDPISINESLALTAQELAALINDYFDIIAESEASSTEQRSTTSLPQHSMAPYVQPLSDKKARQRENISYKYLLPILITFLAGNLLFNLFSHSTQTANTQTPTQNSTTSDAFFTHAYSAPVPGPGCDPGNAEWQAGGIFKNYPSPITNTANHQSVTPTPQVITDDATKTTCQQNGVLVKHDEYFNSFATIFFSYQNQTLPYQFSTQITVSAVSATDSAIFNLGVRDQNSTSDYNGFGNNTMEVGVNGSWTTQRVNDTTSIEEAPFTQGFVAPAKTFTLGAEVDGPQITFFLNNRKVTTIIDTTFPESYGISFGMSDFDAKSPPVARYSHFVYTPLLNTYLNTAIATATAQAKQTSQVPYMASVPGFGCDKGMGQWKPGSKTRDEVTTACLPNGLALSQDTTATFNGHVSFYLLNGNFPMNYKVKAQVKLSIIDNNCAGFTTRRDSQGGGYGFFICSDGRWYIIQYDDISGKPYTLRNGQITQRLSSSYTIEATSNGSLQSLSLDGVQVMSVSDTTFTTTNHIDLSMYTYGTVVFSNFVFTPLP